MIPGSSYPLGFLNWETDFSCTSNWLPAGAFRDLNYLYLGWKVSSSGTDLCFLLEVLAKTLRQSNGYKTSCFTMVRKTLVSQARL
jgi:hypothetical protein